jgi:hypothetical protein
LFETQLHAELSELSLTSKGIPNQLIFILKEKRVQLEHFCTEPPSQLNEFLSSPIRMTMSSSIEPGGKPYSITRMFTATPI